MNIYSNYFTTWTDYLNLMFIVFNHILYCSTWALPSECMEGPGWTPLNAVCHGPLVSSLDLNSSHEYEESSLNSLTIFESILKRTMHQ